MRSIPNGDRPNGRIVNMVIPLDNVPQFDVGRVVGEDTMVAGNVPCLLTGAGIKPLKPLGELSTYSLVLSGG